MKTMEPQLTKPNEWDAMKAVHDAIQPLEAEEQARVLNWAIDKFQIVQKPAARINPAAGGTLSDFSDENEAPKTFVDRKNPQGEVQRVTCLGYYMEKNRKQKDHSNKEIEDLNTEAKQFRFTNISVPLKNAVRSGYMTMVSSKEPGRGNARQLTSLGERIVDALPDQKAVEEVIKKYGKKRRVSRNQQQTTEE